MAPVANGWELSDGSQLLAFFKNEIGKKAELPGSRGGWGHIGSHPPVKRVGLLHGNCLSHIIIFFKASDPLQSILTTSMDPASPPPRTMCLHCNKPLTAIGHARKNGAPHADWPTREYHKKCWKEVNPSYKAPRRRKYRPRRHRY